MDKINWGRVVLGGMAAGVVMIALATASGAIFGPQSVQATAQAVRTGMGALFLVFVFLFLGIMMTWWYAAIRPRFGAGPKTAAIAGLAVWLIVVGQLLKSVATYEPSSNLPAGPMMPLIYLGMIIASTEVGAWVYRE
jgi:hypothetical protein